MRRFLPTGYGLTRRDGLLIVIGSSILITLFQYYFLYSTSVAEQSPFANHNAFDIPTNPDPYVVDFGLSQIPETKLIDHAPGWTLFENLYFSNGTLFIVSSDPSRFPSIRMITSTGLLAFNTPENIRLREPTDKEMQIISPEHATMKWGGDIAKNERNRISSIEGISLLVNETGQFLNHYYHFVAELMLGAWAFLYGAFNPTGLVPSNSTAQFNWGTLTSFNHRPKKYQPPPLSRLILLHSTTTEWKDKPGFNQYFFHAAFPSLEIEDADIWNDRNVATSVNSKSPHLPEKAWHFPVVLLSDRSAANRGEACGSRTQRIAAEAWEYMAKKQGIDLLGQWWSDIRHRVYRFAGAKIIEKNFDPPKIIDVADPQTLLPLPPDKVVITYINRQSVRRHLVPENHDALVASIEELVQMKQSEGKNWEFRDVQPERLSKDEQVRLASETTILLGVHGNGLSHLVFMEPNRFSAVIELFYPGGFAHDYEWTARALGMRHYSVWNDTYFTYPDEPSVAYPDGFQGTSIPVHGPTVARLIEDRLEGRLQYLDS